MNKYMELAIKEAKYGIRHHHGGPFGAIIVKSNKVIAKAHNRVLYKQDSTCHGEMEAIRKASKNFKKHNLKGCTLYTTAEPCHMCLCASMWANIDKIYYGATINDTEEIGFRDEKFNEIFSGRDKLKDYMECIDRDECLKLFEEYKKSKAKRY